MFENERERERKKNTKHKWCAVGRNHNAIPDDFYLYDIESTYNVYPKSIVPFAIIKHRQWLERERRQEHDNLYDNFQRDVHTQAHTAYTIKILFTNAATKTEHELFGQR